MSRSREWFLGWGSDGCAGTANKIQFFMAIWYRCCERLYELAQLIAEYVVVVSMRSMTQKCRFFALRLLPIDLLCTLHTCMSNFFKHILELLKLVKSRKFDFSLDPPHTTVAASAALC